MALLYTYAMLLNKLTEDLDLISEPFISTDEILGYMNEAIEDAETAVHLLGIEDSYFLAYDYVYLTSGQSQYNLPTDIYANKIRKMYYRNPTSTVILTPTLVSGLSTITVSSATGLSQGMAVFGTGVPTTTKIVSVVGLTVTISKALTASGVQTITFVAIPPIVGSRQYEVKKIRNLMDTCFFYPGDNYSYLIQNLPQAAGGNQLLFFPPPVETGPLIQTWYIREMARLTTSTTDPYNVCELPECVNFVFQHVKWRVAKKRRIADVVASEEASLKNQYNLLQETLREMIPDGNNLVQMDLSSIYSQELDLYY